MTDSWKTPGGRPWSLRVRATAAFAISSLAIIGVLGIVTYQVAQHYLVQQRERSLQRRAFLDAKVLRDEVQRGVSISDALRALDLGSRSSIAVRTGGRWHVAQGATRGDTSQVSEDMQRRVESGAVVSKMVERGGYPNFVIGLPVPAIDGQYYETFVLVELDRTLGILRTALIGGGVLALVVGGLLGWWMSGRILRPVRDVAVAAERVAGGDLHIRISAGPDADLTSLASSFNHMVDAVESRIERESRFVADVSHELRSPLTTLATATQIMVARKGELAPSAAEALEHLEHEVVRLQQLVEDLLELGGADAGVWELQLEPVDVGELVRQSLATGDHEAPQIVLPDTSVWVRLDKRRLSRVLANLVSNAETHGGGLRRVAVAGVNGVVRVEVDDDGPGVTPEDRVAVFDRFYRGAVAGRRGSTPGAGLGLALVAEHVQLHGGRVWVEQADAGGARFVVELPRDDPRDAS